MKISIIGLGFVGNAMFNSFSQKVTNTNIIIYGYDKFKNIGIFNECFDSDIIFLALPTPFDEQINAYNYDAIYEVCYELSKNNFNGLVIIKSTITPNTIELLEEKYKLKFVHNPEFLSAKTAYEDFNNQKHIVLGKGNFASNEDMNIIIDFYKKYYPDAKISLSSSNESECMKIFCNTFYSVKIQFFNELYCLCKKLNINYDRVVELMLENKWINPMHTQVPGSDGKLSYGGMCFPKDTNALLEFMKKYDSPHKVLDATIKERNEFRK